MRLAYSVKEIDTKFHVTQSHDGVVATHFHGHNTKDAATKLMVKIITSTVGSSPITKNNPHWSF